MKNTKSVSQQTSVIVLLLLFLPFVTAAKMYKWTDENGKVHFSDKPPLTQEAEEVKPSFVQSPLNDEGRDSARAGETNKRKMLSLPDGTKYPAPHTEEEIEAFQKAVQRSITQKMKRVRQVQKPPPLIQPKKQANVFHNKSQLGATPLQSSFGKKYTQQIKILDGKLKKRVGKKGIDVIERPVTSSKIFSVCDLANLKPGTKRSGLCDLWDEHLAYLDSRLKKECVVAGEKIYKTVSNVDGFLLSGLEKNQNSSKHLYHDNVIHELPARSFNEYIVPSKARLYRQIEYYDDRQNVYVTKKITGIRRGGITSSRSHVPKIDIETFNSTEPQSDFEVGYRDLTSKEDYEQGLFGDLTWVKDRRSNETLAERTIYYLMVKKGVHMFDGTPLTTPAGRKLYYGRDIRLFYPCESYVPRVTQFEKYHPRSAYEFVSRVLIPTPFTEEENHYLYDLSIADGNIKHNCVGLLTLGPGITPDNLLVTRVKDDLTLAIKGGDGALTCGGYFSGAHWDISLMFVDGLHWKENQILEHGNIIREKK